ncbi:hypothetical protein IBK40_24965, partial [Escherichia coli]|nr:hypothetical protein [Escherichia coli]
EREERHVGNAIVGQSINHCIISTVRDVVFVLHTDNFGNLASLGATPMQVALAWLLQRSPNILLIPGSQQHRKVWTIAAV